MFIKFARSRFREQQTIVNLEHNTLINIALDNLAKTAHITGAWNAIGVPGIDGQIELILEEKTVKLNVEVKNNLRAIHLPALYELAQNHAPLMVIAEHIFPKIKEELRNHHIAYLEKNGNIWLKHEGGLLWIDTNKALPEEKEKINRAFTKTGLKTVFDFLLNENLINMPYRDIARHEDIALGNVNYIINGLKEKEFLLKLNQNTIRLTNKRALLNTWITKYDERLKPELEIGTFRFLKNDDFTNWKQIPLKGGKTWWGGEPGADLLTHYLRPGILTLYTIENRNELIKNYRLIPDPKGNVKVYQKFWTHDDTNNNIVPPLLIYADLINTGDQRCIETAQKLYDEFLKGQF